MDEEERRKAKSKINTLVYAEAALICDLRAVRGEIEALRRKLEER